MNTLAVSWHFPGRRIYLPRRRDSSFRIMLLFVPFEMVRRERSTARRVMGATFRALWCPVQSVTVVIFRCHVSGHPSCSFALSGTKTKLHTSKHSTHRHMDTRRVQSALVTYWSRVSSSRRAPDSVSRVHLVNKHRSSSLTP